VIVDPTEQIATRRQDLLHEAHLARLAAEVPHRPSAVRHELALACLRLADWLAGSPAARQPQMGTFGRVNRDLWAG
jgi:hypothetical protein